MAGVAQLVERWIVIPWAPSNINDLSPKYLRTFAYKRVVADKMQTNFIFTIRYMVKVTISQKRENGGIFLEGV